MSGMCAAASSSEIQRHERAPTYVASICNRYSETRKTKKRVSPVPMVPPARGKAPYQHDDQREEDAGHQDAVHQQQREAEQDHARDLETHELARTEFNKAAGELERLQVRRSLLRRTITRSSLLRWLTLRMPHSARQPPTMMALSQNQWPIGIDTAINEIYTSHHSHYRTFTNTAKARPESTRTREADERRTAWNTLIT